VWQTQLDAALHTVMLLSDSDSQHQAELQGMAACVEAANSAMQAAESAERTAQAELQQWEGAWGEEKAEIKADLRR
jgi:hypothetical protein